MSDESDDNLWLPSGSLQIQAVHSVLLSYSSYTCRALFARAVSCYVCRRDEKKVKEKMACGVMVWRCGFVLGGGKGGSFGDAGPFRPLSYRRTLRCFE